MTPRVLAGAAVTLGVAAMLWAAVELAGTSGLVVAALLASAVAVSMIRLRLSADRHAGRPRRAQPSSLAPFHAYRRIDVLIGWDTERGPTPGTIKFLHRVARAVLAERRGVDLDRDPDAARGLLGERAWALLCMHTEIAGSAGAEIAHVADRLEGL